MTKFEDKNCTYNDWVVFLPDELRRTEAYWRAKRDFAPFFKLNGQRSQAWWSRSSIYAHFEIMFASHRPDILEAMRKAGFGPEKPQKSFQQPKRRKSRGVGRPRKPTAEISGEKAATNKMGAGNAI